MAPRRSARRWSVGRTLVAVLVIAPAVVLGAVILAGGGAFLLLKTGYGQRLAESGLERLLNGAGGVVALEGLRGLPFDPHLERLTAADSDGVWLELNGVDVQPAVAAVLRGRAHLRALEVGSVKLIRRPSSGPLDRGAEGDEPAFQLPDIPPIQIDRIHVAEITLEPALASAPVTMTLDGDLAAGADASPWIGRFRLERSDGGRGHAALTTQFERREGALEVEAALEDPDGLLVRALGLPVDEAPGAGATSLLLKGAGPVRAWPATLRVEVGGMGRFEGEAMASAGPEPKVRLEGLLAPEPVLLRARLQPPFDALFNDPVALEGELTRRADGRLVVDRLQARNATAALAGTARFAPSGRFEAATFALETADLGVFATALLGRSLSGRGELTGTLTGGDGELGAELAGQVWELAGLPPALSGIGERARLAGTLTYRPGERLGVESGRFESPTLRLAGGAVLGFSDDTLAGKVALEIPDLAAFEAALPHPLAGRVEVHTDLAGSPRAPVAKVAAAAIVSDPVAEVEATFRGSGNLAWRRADQRLVVRDLKADIEAEGPGLPNDQVTARLDGAGSVAFGSGPPVEGSLHLAAMGLTVEADAGPRDGADFVADIRVQPFNPKALLADLGLPTPPMGANALEQGRLAIRVHGGPEQIRIEPIEAMVDDTNISGNIVIGRASPPVVRFDLDVDALDVDRYMAREDDPEATTGGDGLLDDLPRERLRQWNVGGVIHVGVLTLNGLETENVDIDLTLDP